MKGGTDSYGCVFAACTVPGIVFGLSFFAASFLEGVLASNPDTFFGLIGTVLGGLVLFVLSLPAIVLGSVVGALLVDGLNAVALGDLSPHTSMAIYCFVYAALPYAIVALFADRRTPSIESLTVRALTFFVKSGEATPEWEKDLPKNSDEKAKERKRVELATQLEETIAKNRRAAERIKEKKRR